jgi:hypothetical protein
MTSRNQFVSMFFILHALLLHCSLTDAGSSFIRWGRTTCPTGTKVLYKGQIAGGHFYSTGSGANYVCLNEKPTWSPKNNPGGQDHASEIYAAEYQVYVDYAANNPLSYDNNGGVTVHDQDAVCVRCYRPNSSDTMMMPGRQDCGEGNVDWILEYKGILMAERRNHNHPTEYICVDDTPEVRAGGAENKDGALLYPVEAMCGALACPNYIDRYEVTCAVCSI